MTELTEADIIEERRVPERDEVAALLAQYFVASSNDVADRLHAVIVALAADPSRLKVAKSSFRANGRRYFGQAWKEDLSRHQSLPRMRDLVAWIAVTEPGYPAPKSWCPPVLVGRFQGKARWQLDANGSATIEEPFLATTKRWCVHRQGDPGPEGDALWLYDQDDERNGLQIEACGDVLRVTPIGFGDGIFELARQR